MAETSGAKGIFVKIPTWYISQPNVKRIELYPRGNCVHFIMGKDEDEAVIEIDYELAKPIIDHLMKQKPLFQIADPGGL